MPRFVVVGLINLETTLRVEGFPIGYAPVRYPFNGIRSTVSGVGYNLAKALTALGQQVDFLSMAGADLTAQLVGAALQHEGIATERVLPRLSSTPQSVVAYAPDGQRAIFTDLKDAQAQAYPAEIAAPALAACDWALLCNINFSRPLLAQAQALGKPIATDVHAISDLHDSYNRDYMAAAAVLFQSHERLANGAEAWIRGLWATYGTPVAVVGMGAAGALLGLRAGERLIHVPARAPRPIVNSIGAGDALYSSFMAGYATHGDPIRALRQAVLFAGWKIGAVGAAEGFLAWEAWQGLCAEWGEG